MNNEKKELNLDEMETVNGAGQTERLEKDIDRPAAGKIRVAGKDKKDGKGKGRLICTTINPSA